MKFFGRFFSDTRDAKEKSIRETIFLPDMTDKERRAFMNEVAHEACKKQLEMYRE